MQRNKNLRRVLVTGGAGFIGSHLVRRLAAEGREVHVLHRVGGDLGRLGDLSSSARFWPCDLLDTSALRDVLEAAQPCAIFHLAGDSRIRHFDAALGGTLESVDLNVRTSLNLFVTASTAKLPDLALMVRLGGLEEYGLGPLPYLESQREQPVSPYSASQVAVTHYFQMLAPRLRFRALTVRPALVFGPSQSQQFLIPALISHCLSGSDFTLHSAAHGRDLIYIDDLIDALTRLLEVHVPTGEIINLSCGREYLMGDVAARVIQLSGSKTRLLTGGTTRPGLIEHLYASSEKARRLLDWQPAVSLDDGLRRTISAFASSR